VSFYPQARISLLLRFYVATKIQYVRLEGVWSVVLLTFSLDCALFVFSLYRMRLRLTISHCLLPCVSVVLFSSCSVLYTIRRRRHVRISRDAPNNLTFLVDIRENTKNGLRWQRFRLESWRGVVGDPRVDPLLLIRAYLLLRGDQDG